MCLLIKEVIAPQGKDFLYYQLIEGSFLKSLEIYWIVGTGKGSSTNDATVKIVPPNVTFFPNVTFLLRYFTEIVKYVTDLYGWPWTGIKETGIVCWKHKKLINSKNCKNRLTLIRKMHTVKCFCVTWKIILNVTDSISKKIPP